jgi:hypothetical protein
MQQRPSLEPSNDPTSQENSPHFVKTVVSLPYPQFRATCNFPGLDQCSPRSTILFIEDPFPLKADSHIAYRDHAVPLPCHALIHTCHAAPLPCSNSAVSFVKVRFVAGNIRTASPTV